VWKNVRDAEPVEDSMELMLPTLSDREVRERLTSGERALEGALQEVSAARQRTYYSGQEDSRDREQYYAHTDLEGADLYSALSKLLQSTHTTLLAYQPSLHVYPWLDVQPNLQLRSVYSGKEFSPEQLILEDMRIEAARAARIRELFRTEARVTTEAVDLLEAALPYNCEHVVPQSWFGKREPMRGDLHHLFACESGCNSFRGNMPYFDFPDFQEVIRSECGKREGNRFEPGQGKGTVARAVLYFLMRYPGQVDATDTEYRSSGLPTLIQWHKAHEVTTYELHRNSVAFQKQGNRNPLIDFPNLVDRIEFEGGLG
jgi:endonuclease G